jgi:hypothetical protein
MGFIFIFMRRGMSSNTFFHSTPYRPHASKTKTSIHKADSLLETCLEGKTTALNAATIDVAIIHQNQKKIARSLYFYDLRLTKIKQDTFKFLNRAQRQALEEELLNTADLLIDECELYAFQREHPLLRQRAAQLEHCLNLLYQLRTAPPPNTPPTYEAQLQTQLDDSADKPARYIALTLLAPKIAHTMLHITNGERLETLREGMSDLNMHRLNWVWGGGLDHSLLDLMPAHWGNKQGAETVFSAISPVTGYMSFILYYCRLGINLYLLTKGSLKGSWMDPWQTEEERAVHLSIYERFQTQWEQRQFAIINDVFWATANMACFLWLVKDGILGCTLYMGNALTAVLLLMDLVITMYDYTKQATEYRAGIAAYDEEEQTLEGRIRDEEDSYEKEVLKEHLAVLLEAKKAYQLDWKYTDKKLYSDAVYAACLLGAFALACCFFFPPAWIIPATGLILSVVGAALSCVLTIVHNVGETNLEIEKLQEQHENTVLRSIALTLMAGSSNITAETTQCAQIELASLNEELTHQEQLMAYYRNERIRQLCCEVLIPVCAFAFLVFLPLGVGLPMLVPIIALLLLSGTLMEQHKPEDLHELIAHDETGQSLSPY